MVISAPTPIMPAGSGGPCPDAELVAAAEEFFRNDEWFTAADGILTGGFDDAQQEAMGRRSRHLLHYMVMTQSNTVTGVAAKARIVHLLFGNIEADSLLPLDGHDWHDDVGPSILLSMMRDAVRLAGRAQA